MLGKVNATIQLVRRAQLVRVMVKPTNVTRTRAVTFDLEGVRVNGSAVVRGERRALLTMSSYRHEKGERRSDALYPRPINTRPLNVIAVHPGEEER